ncbi:MAG: SPOR domain-containing protein [Acidiphilium sp.]
MDDQEIDIPPYASPRLRTRGMDRETRRMATVAGGLAVAIVAVALVWSGIHTGLGPPPVVKAPAGPMRTVPTNPGGLQVPGAHEQIMSGDVASGPPQLAPVQAPPDFSKLDQETAEAGTDGAKPVSMAPPKTAAALPLPPAPELAPETMPTTQAVKPVPAPASIMPPTSAPQQATSAGPHAVQLAALISMRKADAAWQTLVARVPDILGGKQPVVVPGKVRGTTFYRLRLGGFASANAAAGFCARLKSRGVTCYIPK